MIFTLLALAFGALAVGGVAAVVFIICFEDVIHNLQRHKLHKKDIGLLVRQHMENGNVRIIGSVFSKRPLGILPRTLQHEEMFEGKMDSRLENMFGADNRIKVSI